MLVIRRRANESLVLGDDIEVEVLEIESSQVKLGIRAPRQVRVLRGEIAETERANRAASCPPEPEMLERLAERFGSNPKPPQR